MTKVAVIGTVGLPANYGGFETLVENLVCGQIDQQISYTVFCSSKRHSNKAKSYGGADLRYLPLDANGAQSIAYDMLSIFKSLRQYDVLLVLGTSGCLLLPLVKWLCKGKIIVNIDGLEHRRAKWGKWTKRFLKQSERIAVRFADIVVADNKAIADYVRQEYGASSQVIAYGGDHAVRSVVSDDMVSILSSWGLKARNYGFSVCRIEPENNVEMTLEAFSQMPSKTVVVVGNWNKSDYGQRLRQKSAKCSNIKLIDPIYDLQILNVLRSNAAYYIHGHSAGGTNPSLVEAMFFDVPILCFDVVYNRETTESKAAYYANSDSLISLLTNSDRLLELVAPTMEVALRRYKWSIVVKQYEQLY